MTTLQDLWYRNIRPNEDKIITDEEKRLMKLIARHHETLSSSLKNDDLDVFEKYVDCFKNTLSLIEAQAFEIGFKLAVKMLKNNQATPGLIIYTITIKRPVLNYMRNKKELKISSFFMAAVKGFEPLQTESESGVLPLHYTAMY